MTDRIWLSPPHMGGNEQTFVEEAFKSNWIAPLGPNVNGFEQGLKDFLTEDIFVAALSSGTAAIHLALILLGVKAGDTVLCQSKTFSASANPIVYLGAHPVFIDSEPSTWNMDPDLLKTAIEDQIQKGRKPKAIVAVHLYGMPYLVDEIHHIAESYNIPVIEDSAEALGSTYKGRKCGTFGEFGILSFNGNKIITTSGGGALVCKSEEMKNKAVFLSTQARDKDAAYLHSHIGYNYRMSNVVAGIGRGQLEVLDKFVLKRRDNHEFYKNALQSEMIKFLKEPEGLHSNRWLTCVITDSYERREKIRLALEAENIESRPLWKPMHQQPVFRSAEKYLNGVSDDLFEKGLCLPSGSNLTDAERHRIVEIIENQLS